MRPIRLAACAAVAALVATPAASGAAPSCPMVTDPKGDHNRGSIVPPENKSPSLDVVSGDLVSDARNVTMVMRLVALDAYDMDSPTGHFYEVELLVAGKTRYLRATHGPDGYAATVHGDGHAEGFLGDASVTVNADRAEVTVTAPASLVGVANGMKLRRVLFIAGTHHGFNGRQDVRPFGEPSNGGGARVDTAKARDYVAGSRGCVRVGS